MKRTLVFTLALFFAGALAASGCAGGSGGGGLTTGIQGTAEVGPMCPVLVQGSPCPNRPMPNATIRVMDSSNKVVAQDRSDASGYFKIPVAPGAYTVRGESPTGLRRSSAPVVATVSAGGYTSVRVVFDSGIR